MFRPLSMNIGVRYAGSSHGYLSLVTFVALASLALSVSVLLFVQGVVAGFERELTNRILGVIPHVSVSARESIAGPSVKINGSIVESPYPIDKFLNLFLHKDVLAHLDETITLKHALPNTSQIHCKVGPRSPLYHC